MSEEPPVMTLPLEPDAAASIEETRVEALPRFALVGALALALLLPALLSGYQTFELTQALIYAIALLGLNILTGYNGQISLGHGAFYAAGAYVSAILMHRWGIPWWATIPPAGLAAFILGVLVGLPALRLEGLYLALVTLSMAVAAPQILKYFDGWTGGAQGILLQKPAAPAFTGLGQDAWLYYAVLAVLLVMFWFGANLLRGRTGRALVAIRDHPISATAMGIDLARYKTLAFGVSALFTGVAGALGALLAGFVSPDSFGFLLSITLIVGSVVGGIGTISGAIFGGLFIEFVPTFAGDISDAAPWAIFGLFLLVFMYAMPQGIAGFLKDRLGRLARPRGSRQQ
jgi:branched-chain amino acid transport system permease protein